MRRFRPDGALLEARPHIWLSNYWDLDGFLETSFQHFDVHWEFKNGYRIDTGINYLKDGIQEPFEIIDGVRQRCGEDFMLGVRLSPERPSPALAEAVEMARRLMAEDRLDFLEELKAPERPRALGGGHGLDRGAGPRGVTDTRPGAGDSRTATDEKTAGDA